MKKKQYFGINCFRVEHSIEAMKADGVDAQQTSWFRFHGPVYAPKRAKTGTKFASQ